MERTWKGNDEWSKYDEQDGKMMTMVMNMMRIMTNTIFEKLIRTLS